MKKLLLSFGIIIICTASFAQSIKENFIDEFTGNRVIRTSWVNVMTMKANAYIRFSQVNTSTTMDVKLMIGGDVFSIPEGAELMFKMDSDKIIKFKCLKGVVTSRGGGAIGLSGSGVHGLLAMYLPADSSDFSLLSNATIKKMRIYTSDGYVDQNVSQGESASIRKAFAILKEEDTKHEPQR